MASGHSGHFIDQDLPPDIVEAVLPYLSSEDIKNLSLTNKYFHRLLDFERSSTLWHELFHKAFGSTNSNDEPLISKGNQGFMSCCEAIMTNKNPDKTWLALYKLRSNEANFYTWGCLKHARLGYTAVSHGNLPEVYINNAGMRLKFGINTPVRVPGLGDASPTNSKESNNEQDLRDDDNTIVQISAGGFSFQILTKSGKLYSTGSTYTGGHKGPGPKDGEHDHNPFQELAANVERNFTPLRGIPIRIGGVFPINTTGVMPHRLQLPRSRNTAVLEEPHEDIYARFQDLQDKATEFLPGNKHIRRMFVRDELEIYQNAALDADTSKSEKNLEPVKFLALSSGRSHFLALSTNNELYSWDGPEVEHGIKINLENISDSRRNPILKIGCGWNFSCALVYEVGLIIWDNRQPVKKGEGFSNANYKIIPNTAEINGDKKIVDFACCAEDCVFFINATGEELWLYSRGATRSVNLQIEGKLEKIEGSYSTLALFTDAKCYTIEVHNGGVSHDSLQLMEVEDTNDRFISLSTGDYHAVALTSTGKIFTWGLESELCGCLGLGPSNHVVLDRHVGVFENNRSIRVTKPTQVLLDSDYTCVAITAGGWQTGALIIKQN